MPRNLNLTQGSIVKNLILFSLPLVLSGLLQQLYNWADAFIVGNVEGELQLAAIGATGSVSSLLIMMITGFTVGTTILAANLYGGGQGDKMKTVLSSFALVMGGVFLVASVLGAAFTGSILRLLNTPADILPAARDYMRIIFFGIPFIGVYNVYAAVLRGMGDSRTPFLAVAVSAFTNVLLDVLLVVVFPFGAVGAAVATVASQVLMTVFIVIYSAKRHPVLRFKINRAAIDRSILRRGFRLSIPTAIQSSIHSVGSLLMQNVMNGFGTQTVAAITTAYRIDSIILLPINNLGAGITTVTAQNMGAGQQKRAGKSLLYGTILMSVVALALTAAIIPTGGALISLFGVQSEAVEIGGEFFRIIAPSYFLFSVASAIKGYLEGIGDVMASSALGIASLVVRVVLAYLLMGQVGNRIIALAEALSWAALLVMCAGRLLYVMRRQRQKDSVAVGLPRDAQADA